MEFIGKLGEPKILLKWIISIAAFLFIISCCLLLKFSPYLLVAFIFVIIYIFAVSSRPSLGAYAYVFTLAFAAFFNLPITQDGLRLSTILVLLAFLVWLLRALITSDQNLITKPVSNIIHFLICLILLTMVVSLLNSRNVGASIGEIKQFIYCLTAYFLILFTIRNTEQLRNIVIIMVCAGFIVSIFGIMEGTIGNIYTHLHNKSLFRAPLGRTILWTSIDRINGLIGDGDSHGMYMGIIFLFALGLFFTFKPKAVKILLLIAMLSSLLNVIGAASRGAALGFIISFLVFWVFINLRRKWLILTCTLTLFLIIGLLMIALIPDLNIERFYDPKLEAEKTVDLRKNNILIGLAMAKDHPIIGTGPDGFMINYLRYGPRITPSARRIPTKPLNTYVQALAEYGIVGLSLFLLITIFVIKSLLMLLKKFSGENKYLATAIFATFCGYTSFMNTTGFFVDQTYWLLVALAGTLITIYGYEIKASKKGIMQ